MRKTDMQVNVSGIRRQIKNIAHNYSDAQKKVREATSNDQWGPSSTLMTEIADLTYNVVAFTEIMQMVWRRLNDDGRYWRHVYKALVLLEYLIKTGSEKVGQQCKENIYAIQTLKDFQHIEEGKDQGQNVREKARHLVILLKDDERLKSERARALKAKERFAQSSSAFGSDGGLETPPGNNFRGDWGSSRDTTDLPREIEVARPQTAGEEELQLQLALAMSREEAEQEEQKKRSDEVRLQMALSVSQQDFKTQDKPMLDLLDVNLDENKAVDPWGMPKPPRSHSTTNSPWHAGGAAALPTSPPPAGPVVPPVDPWAPVSHTPPPHLSNNNHHHNSSNNGAWSPAKMMAPSPPTTIPLQETAIRHDPWSPASQSSTDLDEFDIISNRRKDDQLLNNGSSAIASNNTISDPFELNLLGDMLPINISNGPSPSTGATKKTPLSFLGENSGLVNLDNLVASKPASTMPQQINPFADGPLLGPTPPPAVSASPRSVFNPPAPKPPTINQIKHQQHQPFVGGAGHTTTETMNGLSGGMLVGNGGMSMAGGATALFAANNAAAGGNLVLQPQPIVGLTTAAMPVAVTQDPWAPAAPTTAPQAVTGAAAPSPWMRPGEAAVNPFLS